jgi:hypothetical protein
MPRLVQQPSNIASSLFGPEYVDATSEDLGLFEIGAKQVKDIVYNAPNIPMTMLPPGGYVLRYISGNFILLDTVPTKFVVGGHRGLQVEWSSEADGDWIEHPFAVDDQLDEPNFVPSTDISDLTYIEFTKSHRLRLSAPSKAAGTVKIRVVRYVPEFLSDWDVENLLEKAK